LEISHKQTELLKQIEAMVIASRKSSSPGEGEVRGSLAETMTKAQTELLAKLEEKKKNS